MVDLPEQSDNIRDEKGRFKPGNSGNPGGKVGENRTVQSRMRSIMDMDGADMLDCIELYKKGRRLDGYDHWAIRVIMSSLEDFNALKYGIDKLDGKAPETIKVEGKPFNPYRDLIE